MLDNLIEENETPSIDHVIPWSYLYSDDLRKLGYAHRSYNSSKSNVILSEDIIVKLEERNRVLLERVRTEAMKEDKRISELEFATPNNLVRLFWISAKDKE